MIKKLTALAVLSGVLLTGCSSVPSAASGYSGPAVVQDTHQGSSKHGCDIRVKMNKRTEEAWIRVGRRTRCDGYPRGKIVEMKDGQLIRK